MCNESGVALASKVDMGGPCGATKIELGQESEVELELESRSARPLRHESEVELVSKVDLNAPCATKARSNSPRKSI